MVCRLWPLLVTCNLWLLAHRIKPDHGSSEEMKMKKMEIRKELVALLDSDCPDLITLYGAYMDSDDCMNICLVCFHFLSVMGGAHFVGCIP